MARDLGDPRDLGEPGALLVPFRANAGRGRSGALSRRERRRIEGGVRVGVEGPKEDARFALGRNGPRNGSRGEEVDMGPTCWI